MLTHLQVRVPELPEQLELADTDVALVVVVSERVSDVMHPEARGPSLEAAEPAQV